MKNFKKKISQALIGLMLVAGPALAYNSPDLPIGSNIAGHLVTTVANKLNAFASTTAAELRGVISGTTGTNNLVFSDAPTINNPTFTGTITGNITGNASTATALQTARTINGVSFDGTGNITVTAAAGTLTGTTLASNVVTSSLTTVGTIGTGVWQGTPVADAYVASSSTWNAKQAALPAGTTTTVLHGNASGSPSYGAVALADMAAGSVNSLLGYNGSGVPSGVTIGSGLSLSSGTLTATGSGGTVTTVSVASANGFAGSVATATTTPAITISTTVTGVLKGNGTAISAATAGTDYSAGTSGLATGILKSTTTTGALTIAVAGDFPTLNQSTSGNAATATALATSRNINGVAFDGTGNITVTAAAGTLTGTTLASNVVSSSLTSVGTLANLTVTNPITGSITGNAATATALATAGTTTTVLHGNASGAPTYAAVALGTDVSGTLLAAQFPALTGDVTTSAGSVATTIANLAVTNAKIANSTIDLTAKVTGALPFANGGCNGTTVATCLANTLASSLSATTYPTGFVNGVTTGVSRGEDIALQGDVAIGNATLKVANNVGGNTAIGAGALQALAGIDAFYFSNPNFGSGVHNTAIGYLAGSKLDATGATLGSATAGYTTLVGAYAGRNLVTPTGNGDVTCIGDHACVHLGLTAGSTDGNTFVGGDAQGPNVGTNNTMIGNTAGGFSGTSYSNNTAVGYGVLGQLTTGSANAILSTPFGYDNILTGINNILLAAGSASNCNAPSSSTSNTFRVCGTNGNEVIVSSAIDTSAPTTTIIGTTALATATATTLNKVTITTPASSATLTIANGKTLTANNTLTLAGTDSTTMTFPAASDTIGGLATIQSWTAKNTYNIASTIASSASAVLDDLNIAAATTTVTGTTGITTAKGFNKFSIYRPTITDGSAVAITNSATLYVENSPAAAGSATITNPYALWVDDGNTRLDGSLTVGATSTATTATISSSSQTALTVQSANASGVQIALKATVATGHEFDFYSTGTNQGVGYFGVFDATIGATPFAVFGGTSSTAGQAIDTTANGTFAWASDATFAGGGDDTSLSRKAAGVVGVGTGAAGSVAGIVQAAAYISGLNTVVATQFDKAANTTLGNITNLTATVVAGKTYHFRANLFHTSDVTGGQKYAMAGTATATSIIYEIKSLCDATNLTVISSRQTALAGSAGQAGCAAGNTVIEGTIVVNAGGTLIPQFAQNAASGTSSIIVGSTFLVDRLN